MLLFMLCFRDIERNETGKLHKDRHSCLLCSLLYLSRPRTVPGKSKCSISICGRNAGKKAGMNPVIKNIKEETDNKQINYNKSG